jgi:hypothetical protein
MGWMWPRARRNVKANRRHHAKTTLRGKGHGVAKSRPVASARPVQRALVQRALVRKALVRKAGDLIATAPDRAKRRSGLSIVDRHAVCPVLTILSN